MPKRFDYFVNYRYTKSGRGVSMNKTKKWLLIFSTIFLLLGIGYDIYGIVIYFLAPVAGRSALFYLIFDFIRLGFMISVAVMMIYVLWGNGKHFRERYRYFVSSFIISICLNIFSVSTILMIISIYFNDSVFVMPEQKMQQQEDKDVVDITPEGVPSEKEMKIEALRKMLQEGKITKQQFEEELMKLL